MQKYQCVLVPNQDCEEITLLFKSHFESIAPDGVTVKVTPHHGGQGYVTPIDTIGYKAAAMAYKDTFGTRTHPTTWRGKHPYCGLI